MCVPISKAVGGAVTGDITYPGSPSSKIPRFNKPANLAPLGVPTRPPPSLQPHFPNDKTTRFAALGSITYLPSISIS